MSTRYSDLLDKLRGPTGKFPNGYQEKLADHPQQQAFLQQQQEQQVDLNKLRIQANALIESVQIEQSPKKIPAEDQKELRFVASRKEDLVIIHFNTSVCWLGLGPKEAIDLGEALAAMGAKILRDALHFHVAKFGHRLHHL